jgi:chromosome segregation ATPase
MESKFQLVSKEYEFKLSALQLEKDKSDDKLRAFEKQREEVIKENNSLRSLVTDSESLRAEIEREQEKSRELHKRCHKLETELASNNSLEQELTEINMRLKNELSFNNQEMHRFKDQINRVGKKGSYLVIYNHLIEHLFLIKAQRRI